MRHFKQTENGILDPRGRDCYIIGVCDDFHIDSETGETSITVHGWLTDADRKAGIEPAVIRTIVIPQATRDHGIDELITELLNGTNYQTNNSESVSFMDATDLDAKK